MLLENVGVARMEIVKFLRQIKTMVTVGSCFQPLTALTSWTHPVVGNLVSIWSQ